MGIVRGRAARGLAASGVLLLAACGLEEPVGAPNRYALVLINDTQESRFWSVEQPTGEMTRFELQPCSSTSQDLEARQAWEVEWGAAIAVASDEVDLLAAPYTVVEVVFQPDGAVDVGAPRAAAERPDAPHGPLTCARS